MDFIFADTNGLSNWAPCTFGSASSGIVNPYDYSSGVLNKNGCLYLPYNFYLISNEPYIPELIITAAETHSLKAKALKIGLYKFYY